MCRCNVIISLTSSNSNPPTLISLFPQRLFLPSLGFGLAVVSIVMKAFGSPRTGRVSPSEALTPSSQKQRPPRIPKENVDPCPAPSDRSPFRSPANSGKPLSAKNRSLLPPRPPISSKPGANPLKRKLSSETPAENGVSPSSASDSGVQVIVRMRPPDKVEEEADLIVEKVSENSVTVFDHNFTFDSVVDIRSTQEDMFQLVGLPLVETCLAGFNSSIFAYGQTGSGKTYTMWGPPSALSDYASSSIDKGLTPRVFERLFSRIDEIYNEQITDLLEPTRRNLQIREDVKTGVYVDFLTEEYVSTINDVNQLLMKGLANRRIGATRINMESSRSHCVFTCIIESHSKSTVDGLISIKTSRINLVDLAGSERQKQTRAAGEQLKEASNINRSLSQLGNLINILAEVSKSWKQRHIPYRDSKLTFLLQESLGGNAKLAMICAISPLRSCKNETLSTLRFAQRAKSIKNKAVVNEVMQDDVNVLREQIRLLKDELLRMKSNGSSDNNGGYSTAWNARRSLHILKMSLVRPKPLPVVKDDSDEEMEIDENDVEMLDAPQSASARLTISKETKLREIELVQVSAKSDEKTTYASNTDGLNNQQDDNCVILMNDQRVQTFPNDKLPTEIIHSTDIGQVIVENQSKNSLSLSSTLLPSSLSTVPCNITQVPQVPPLGALAVIDACSRKSLRTSLSISASPRNTLGNSKSTGITNALSTATLSASSSSNCQTKNSPKPTEYLAASLQCGLQMIDKWQHKSVQRDSSFTVRPTDDRQIIQINKVDIGTQTPLQDSQELELSIMCNYCQKVSGVESANVNRSRDMQLVLADGLTANDKHNSHVPKVGFSSNAVKSFAVEQVLAGSIRREMALEDLTTEQAAEIAQLKLLAQQYKYERDCNAMIVQTREDKIARLESLMDGLLPTEEFMQGEFIALENEHKFLTIKFQFLIALQLLKEKYENHSEILQLNIKLKKVQDELDGYRNFFEMSERDVLMEEIQDLRSQLLYYIDPTCSESTQKQSSLLRLTHQGRTIVPLSTFSEFGESDVDNKESKYSLVEELRFELEGSRHLAKKLKQELDSEKKCTEELKDALQTAMQSHTRILEQYADLQEKHTTLLSWNREINDGIDDVMEAATEAGIRGAELKFISSLASEISVLKAERERVKQKWQDKNRALESQLADTVDALEAAGEVLVRLKEAEEAAAVAERRALLAEKETEKMNQEIERLKKNLDVITPPVNCTTESNFDHTETGGSKEADSDNTESDGSEKAKFDAGKGTHPLAQEFEPFCKRGDTELSIDTDPTSWFSDYDRCNM
ncbi:hypothetical protein ZIOFF_000425 [Zingiber officinale]|uniref:Kinesin motor domain-containing protein n=1 Tax=Zingiber officinale TaxID=94328 RepID=A0A8J5HXG6_ZINOF|nr:hypothetical protein ZIOFF_000425 [Zingiber officinale]